MSCCFGSWLEGGFNVSRIKNVLFSWHFRINSDKSFDQIHMNWNGIREEQTVLV